MPTAGSEAHILSQRVLLADCWSICKKGRRDLGSVLLCRKGRTDVPRLYPGGQSISSNCKIMLTIESPEYLLPNDSASPNHSCIYAA